LKKLYLLFLVLVMTVVLSGCNNSLSTTGSLTTTNINPSQTTDENSVVLLKDSHYQYSIYSTENIKILHLNVTSDVEVFDKDMNQLNKEDILLLNNQKYEIKSSYITNHIDSVVEFYLVFNNQKTLVIITKSEKQIPYIISSTLVETDGSTDLHFQFELFSGNIKQISADGLSEEDFVIQGNVVIINKDYIALSLETKTEFIINYVLETDEIVIGFINITGN